MPWIAPRPAYPSKLLIRSILLKAIRARRMVFERILAHRISCQRAITPLSSRKATNNPTSIGNHRRNVNPRLQTFFWISTGFPQSAPTSASPKKKEREASASRLCCSQVSRHGSERELQPPLDDSR